MAHKLYEVGAVPDDDVLAADLSAVCEAYAQTRRMLNEQRNPSTSGVS